MHFSLEIDVWQLISLPRVFGLQQIKLQTGALSSQYNKRPGESQVKKDYCQHEGMLTQSGDKATVNDARLLSRCAQRSSYVHVSSSPWIAAVSRGDGRSVEQQ